MNAKAASRVEAIASIRVFVFARIPPPEDEKKEALRSCSLRGFDFILVILVVVFVFVFGDGGFCRRGHRGGRGEQKKKEEEEEDSAFAATVVVVVVVVDDSIIIIIIFIYTRNCFVVLYVFVVSCVFFCFLFFFFFFFSDSCQCQTDKKNSSVSLKKCVRLDSFQFNNDTLLRHKNQSSSFGRNGGDGSANEKFRMGNHLDFERTRKEEEEEE